MESFGFRLLAVAAKFTNKKIAEILEQVCFTNLFASFCIRSFAIIIVFVILDL